MYSFFAILLTLSFVSPLQRDLQQDSNHVLISYSNGNISVESIHFANDMLTVIWLEEPAFSTIPPQPTNKYRETYEITDGELELVRLEIYITERTHHTANGVSTTTVRRYWQEVPIAAEERLPALIFDTQVDTLRYLNDCDSLVIQEYWSKDNYILLRGQ